MKYICAINSETARPELYYLDSYKVFESEAEAYQYGRHICEAYADYPMMSEFCVIVEGCALDNLPMWLRTAYRLFELGLSVEDVK